MGAVEFKSRRPDSNGEPKGSPFSFSSRHLLEPPPIEETSVGEESPRLPSETRACYCEDSRTGLRWPLAALARLSSPSPSEVVAPRRRQPFCAEPQLRVTVARA